MSGSERLCPFIGRLYKECYSTEMDSGKVEDAIHYCGGNYEECEIYRRVQDDLRKPKLQKTG